jgi:hypothetical protein
MLILQKVWLRESAPGERCNIEQFTHVSQRRASPSGPGLAPSRGRHIQDVWDLKSSLTILCATSRFPARLRRPMPPKTSRPWSSAPRRDL